MKMEAVPDHDDRLVLHIRRPRGTRNVPCRLVLQKLTGLVIEESCDDLAPPPTPDLETATLNAKARRMKLFHQESTCWFDGCEHLRSQYFQDLERLGDDCMPCAVGELMRRYLDHMAKLGV